MEGESLNWSWDLTGHRRQVSSEDPLHDAKRAEFGEQNYERAAALYRQAKDAARYDDGRFWAGLGLARVLAHSGRQPESVNLCRDLLTLPSVIIDDDGLSRATVRGIRMEWFNSFHWTEAKPKK